MGDTASIPVALPNSGLIVRFPCAMGLNPDGSSNFEHGTAPDVECPPEKALDKALELIHADMAKVK